MTDYFTTAHWLELLRSLPREGALLHRNSYLLLTGLPDKTLRQALWRLGRQGVVTHVSGGWYTQTFRPATLDEASAVIVCPSYISLETVLRREGVTTQPSVDLTCVTTKPTVTRRTPLGTVRYHSIAQNLFFGFERRITANGIWVYEAHPEKALLDLVYLSGRTGAGVWLDFDFTRLNVRRLAEYAGRFPDSVGAALESLRRTHATVS